MTSSPYWKRCQNCKYSREATGDKCVKNLNNECGGTDNYGGPNHSFDFAYNNWYPKDTLPEELFEI